MTGEAIVAAQLQRLLSATGNSSIEELIEARYGFKHPQVQPHLLQSMLGSGTVDEEADRIEQTVVEAAVIGETYFLRHRRHLEWLRAHWLPGAAAVEPSRPLRILFVGCSTGEEVWSLVGALGPTIRGLRPSGFEVLALDVSGRALDVARRGIYRSWSLRGVDVSKEAGWLRVRPDGSVELSAATRAARVEFLRHNALEPVPDAEGAGGFDLILCRNLLLYLHEEACAQVWRNLRAALRPRGVILCAATDPTSADSIDLAGEWQQGIRVFRSRAEASAPPAVRPRRPRTAPGKPLPTRRKRPRSRLTAPGAYPPLSASRLTERLAASGSPAMARALLEARLERDPEDIDTLVQLAQVTSEAGQHAVAIATARRAVYLAPDAPYPGWVMALALERAGRVDAANRRRAQVREMLQALDPSTELAHATGLVSGQLLAILEAR